MNTRIGRSTFTDHFTNYEDQTGSGASGAEFVIPENFTTLDDAALTALHSEAVSHFDGLYGDGQGLSTEDYETLTALTDGIESLAVELGNRRAAAAERASAASELASRVHVNATEDGDGDSASASASASDSDGAGDGDAPPESALPAELAVETDDVASTPEAAAESLAAAAQAQPRGPVRVNLARVASRQARTPAPMNTSAPSRIQDVLIASGEAGGYAAGQGLDWMDIGRIVDRRLGGYNHAAFAAAARAGRAMRQQFSVASVRKPFSSDLIVRSNDPQHVEEIMAHAADERRLPGGSLVASGGWCAPSTTLYDLFEIESRDGLFSLPTIGVTRGGINFTPGPDYAAIYAAVPGFDYSEANDIAGNYDVGIDGVGDGTAGSKPCYKVPCPEFEEVRLRTTGLCIQAGLLQARGYPEVISRTVRGALIAHDHRMSGRIATAVCTGSTAVTFPVDTVGATAPLLDAIEKQVEHYRYIHRLARGRTLEAVFPYWVRGVIRSDLALRAGMNAFDITDAQINAWFTLRGIAPQFVYDWQPLTGAAGAAIAWPTTVQFLLYVAGTWVQGSSDVITLDTLYDSTLLAENDYTALFTEEGYLLAMRGHDSRCVTVSLCPDGKVGNAVNIDCDGTLVAATPIEVTVTSQDQTDPTVGTLAASNLDTTSFTLTVSSGADETALDAEPYRFSTDGGVTWTEWQTSAVYNATGLTTGTTYYCRHETRDAAGNISTGAIITATTT